MKVIVYTAETEVPFDEFYKPLGSWNKIILSNKTPNNYRLSFCHKIPHNNTFAKSLVQRIKK